MQLLPRRFYGCRIKVRFAQRDDCAAFALKSLGDHTMLGGTLVINLHWSFTLVNIYATYHVEPHILRQARNGGMMEAMCVAAKL